MKIHEYQAKQLLKQYGVPVPAGQVATNADEAREAARNIGRRVVIKGQVHSGGRGKAGAVKLANTPHEAEEVGKDLIGKTLFFAQANANLKVNRVLVEEAVDIAQEIYLGITQDRGRQRDVLIVSTKGGMDIEEVAHNNPADIAKLFIDPLLGLPDYAARQVLFDAKFDKAYINKAIPFLKALYAAYVGTDATLAEINPLVITKDGQIIAGDAKWDIDENALFRHPEFVQFQDSAEQDPIEAEAHRRGIQYVRLEGGDIGIIGNGAGLVMTTMDEVKRAGGKPADFLDIGGGAKAEAVTSSLQVVLSDPNVKGVLFNIFGGITRGDEVAKGIIEGTKSLDIKVPIVIRLAGTRAEEGAELLKTTDLVPAATMQEAAAKIVELAYAKK
ncbi:MAG: ADP-forming succinate--CoA ligase subunit beta [Armatimonadetes bacterium]|nr:ADP-forming succinate--CoA ligase subunit beta [Armatimonadota bacterium]